MPNFDGVFELRFSYLVPSTGQPTLTHQHTVDVNVDGFPAPGTPFQDITLLSKNGDSLLLSAWIETYIVRLKPFFNTLVEFPIVELWQYPLTGTNAQWISAYEIGEAGTSNTATALAAQSTLTFRSAGGGIFRNQLMETIFPQNSVESAPFSQPVVVNLATFLAADESPVRARDDTYLVAPLKWSLGQNEKLWRKRFRS